MFSIVTSYYFRIPAALVLLCAMTVVSAQQGQVAAAVGGQPLLQPFAESTVIDFQQQSDVNYQLVLGSMRRITGRV